MGCGAVGGQKYQVQADEVNTLSHLGDEAAKLQRPSEQTNSSGLQRLSSGGGDGGHQGAESEGRGSPGGGSSSSKGAGGASGLHVSNGVADRYRAGQPLEGYEVIEGEADVPSLKAAANDHDLLRKYADVGSNGKGKKRPGASKCVFAPAGEPLRYNSQERDDEPLLQKSPEDFQTVSSHAVGGLRLQPHSNLASHGQAGVRVAAR
jgi:hypothetical protein